MNYNDSQEFHKTFGKFKIQHPYNGSTELYSEFDVRTFDFNQDPRTRRAMVESENFWNDRNFVVVKTYFFFDPKKESFSFVSYGGNVHTPKDNGMIEITFDCQPYAATTDIVKKERYDSEYGVEPIRVDGIETCTECPFPVFESYHPPSNCKMATVMIVFNE